MSHSLPDECLLVNLTHRQALGRGSSLTVVPQVNRRREEPVSGVLLLPGSDRVLIGTCSTSCSEAVSGMILRSKPKDDIHFNRDYKQYQNKHHRRDFW